MTGQLSFFGEPEPTDRLFFALFPPTEVAVRIYDLLNRWCEQFGLRGRPVTVERLHVTLHHLGDFAGLSPELVRNAMKSGAALATSAIDVVFDQVASFGSNPKKPMLVLRGNSVEPVIRVQQQLATSISRHCPRVKLPNAYTPHMTLLYGEPGCGEMSVAEQSIAPIRWTATEFVLVHSLLGKHQHIPLARWSMPT